jgi:hypothetical protein
MTNHAPWEPLGLSTTMRIGREWREFRLTFLADRDDDNARITFTQLPKNVTLELAKVSFRPGGVVGLKDGERLEDSSVPTILGNSSPSRASADFCDFLRDTEQTYWQEMRRFLREDLHVRSLVCGTQLGFSTIHVQAGTDYIDNHAYWEHPNFPNRPWDHKDWFINDVALVNGPGGTLAHLAMGRVAGMAYTVTEYNHPAPNSYAAEGFPMIASFGAFQNWDAIYSFAYSHSKNYEPRRIESFFDMKSRPEQLVHTPACVAMFVRGDVAASKQPTVFPFSDAMERKHLHQTHNAWTLTAKALLDDVQYPLLHGTALDVKADDNAKKVVATEGRKALAAGLFVADNGEIRWDISDKSAGFYTVDSPRTKLFTGFVRGRTFALGDVTLKIAKTRLDWATVSLTVIDGRGFGQPGRILIAATGFVQNTDAKLERLGEHRVTTRDQWGDGPILCEGVRATVTLPVASDRVKCYPLDEAGNRRQAIAVGSADDLTNVELDPKHRTLWYEVDIVPVVTAKTAVTAVPAVDRF